MTEDTSHAPAHCTPRHGSWLQLHNWRNKIKRLPTVAIIVALSAFRFPLSAFAAQSPTDVQTVGASQKPAKTVGHCIAKRRAEKTPQQIMSQYSLANDMAMNVYVPGQKPPSSAAALVRPNMQVSGTWMGLRATGDSGRDVESDSGACL